MITDNVQAAIYYSGEFSLVLFLLSFPHQSPHSWGRGCCQPPFTDKGIEAQREGPRVTQLVSGRARIQTQVSLTVGAVLYP